MTKSPRFVVYLISALLLIEGVAAAQTPEPLLNPPVEITAPATIDLQGLYSVDGTNPDGSKYEGIVEIVKKDDVYFVRWTQRKDDGVEQIMGVGILQGETLSVSYYGGSPFSPGLAVYIIGEKQLDGKWTMGGAGKLFKETLTKTTLTIHPMPKPAEPEPTKPPTAEKTLSV